MWGITHSIHPVTSKSVLVCNYLFWHKLHTEELGLTNISESILSGSSVSILSSSSVSISDEIHTLKDDELDTGNSSLFSISYDDLIMEIFLLWHSRIPCPFLLCYYLQDKEPKDKGKGHKPYSVQPY